MSKRAVSVLVQDLRDARRGLPHMCPRALWACLGVEGLCVVPGLLSQKRVLRGPSGQKATQLARVLRKQQKLVRSYHRRGPGKDVRLGRLRARIFDTPREEALYVELYDILAQDPLGAYDAWSNEQRALQADPGYDPRTTTQP